MVLGKIKLNKKAENKAPEGDEKEKASEEAKEVEKAPAKAKAKPKAKSRDPRKMSQRKSYDDPPEEKGPVKYECVLGVREDAWRGDAGDEYKGSGLEDKDRLNHLLKRGAIRKK